MEERQHAQHALDAARHLLQPGQALLRVGPEVAVRQHRALRHARGAAGILQHGDVAVGIDGGGRQRAVIVGQRAEIEMRRIAWPCRRVAALEQAIEQALRRRQYVGHALHDNFLERGRTQQRGRQHIELLDVERDQHFRAGILDQVADFAGGVERVQIHHGAAGHRHREIADHIGRRIGQQQRHARALDDTVRGEARGGAAHQIADLAIGIAAPQKIETRLVAMHGGGVEQQLMDRPAGIIGMPIDSRRIGFKPRPRIRPGRAGNFFDGHHAIIPGAAESSNLAP